MLHFYLKFIIIIIIKVKFIVSVCCNTIFSVARFTVPFFFFITVTTFKRLESEITVNSGATKKKSVRNNYTNGNNKISLILE